LLLEDVLGTQLTSTAKNGLAEYGFDEFLITSTGFVPIRSKPLDHEPLFR
jgi:hypothetical protein